MKTIKYRLFLGQVIRMSFSDGGRCACPVCGWILDGCRPYLEWSYEATERSDNDTSNPARVNREEDKALAIASGSHEICPCCSTQYGDDDFIDAACGSSQHILWSDLRDKWLRSTSITEECRKQLRNIGVEIDDQGHQVSDINLSAPPSE